LIDGRHIPILEADVIPLALSLSKDERRL